MIVIIQINKNSKFRIFSFRKLNLFMQISITEKMCCNTHGYKSLENSIQKYLGIIWK